MGGPAPDLVLAGPSVLNQWKTVMVHGREKIWETGGEKGGGRICSFTNAMWISELAPLLV